MKKERVNELVWKITGSCRHQKAYNFWPNGWLEQRKEETMIAAEVEAVYTPLT